MDPGKSAMDVLLQTLRIMLPVLYCATFAAYLNLFVRHKVSDRSFTRRVATWLLVASGLTHLCYTIARGVHFGHHPMASFHEIISIVSLALVIVYFIIESWRKNKSTGVFVIPVVLALQLVASIGIGPTPDINPLLKDTPFGMHTGTLTLAYSAFFLSSVYGFMYVMFHRALRRKQFGLIFDRFPSLDILARMNRGAAGVGFVFMTIGVGLGLFLAYSRIPGFWTDYKVVGTVITWIVYGFALLGHYMLKWSGRRVAVLTLVAFLSLVFITIIVNLFFTGWHDFLG